MGLIQRITGALWRRSGIEAGGGPRAGQTRILGDGRPEVHGGCLNICTRNGGAASPTRRAIIAPGSDPAHARCAPGCRTALPQAVAIRRVASASGNSGGIPEGVAR